MQKPWREETFTISRFPRLVAYMRGMGCNVERHPISDYWAAVILSDKFTDSQFAAQNVNFADTSGSVLLATIDRMFRLPTERKDKAKTGISESGKVQLMAFLGSRGVKTSKLNGDDDVWKAAIVLWPTIQRGSDLGSLVRQISSFSKAKRKSANVNIKNLPENWKA